MTMLMAHLVHTSNLSVKWSPQQIFKCMLEFLVNFDTKTPLILVYPPTLTPLLPLIEMEQAMGIYCPSFPVNILFGPLNLTRSISHLEWNQVKMHAQDSLRWILSMGLERALTRPFLCDFIFSIRVEGIENLSDASGAKVFDAGAVATRRFLDVLGGTSAKTILNPLQASRDSTNLLDHRCSQRTFLYDTLGSFFALALESRIEALSVHISRPTYALTSSLEEQAENGFELTFSLKASPLFHNRMLLGPLLKSPRPQQHEVDSAKIASSNPIEAFRQIWAPLAELRRFKSGEIRECVLLDEKISTFDPHTHQSDLHPFMLALKHLTQPHSIVSSAFHKLLLPSVNFERYLGWLSRVERMFAENDIAGMRGTVYPASSALSYTSVSDELSLVECVVELEQSALWPNDAAAVHHLHKAFLISLARKFKEIFSEHKCRVQIVLEDDAVIDEAFVDVKFQDGVKLRCWLHAPALRHFLTPSKQKVFDFLHIQLPQHTLAIRTQTLTRPSVGVAIRYLKFWLHSHWLLTPDPHTHVTEHSCEEFSTSTLKFILSTQEPLTLFRHLLHELQCPTTSLSLLSPDPLIRNRIRQLARTSFSFMSGSGAATHFSDLTTQPEGINSTSANAAKIRGGDLSQCFVHGTSDYDVVVKLKPIRGLRIDHVKSFVLELHRSFGNLRVFWNGVNRIGLVFEPIEAAHFSNHPWNMSAQLFKDQLRVQVNRKATLVEILNLGVGVVEGVEVNAHFSVSE